MRLIILLVGLMVSTNSIKAIEYTWNGSISSEWGNPNNWSPSGIPDFGDDVIVVSGSNDILFEEISALNNFTINSGVLDLSMFTIVINGQAQFNGGQITNGAVNFNGSSVIFAGTIFDCNVTAISPSVSINGSTFNNPVTFTKSGSSDGSSQGGNTFNSTFQFTNSGSGSYTLSTVSADTYESTATFRNTGAGITFVSHTASGNLFKGNVVFISTGSSQGIRLGQNGGTATLSSGRTITIGGAGFSSGELRLRNFTQSGTTAQSMTTFSGSAGIYLEANTTFNGNVTFTAPQVFLNGTTFNGTAAITKSGASNNTSQGGNTFNSSVTFAVTGSGDFILGGTSADTFENTVTANVSGNGTMMFAHTSLGNLFKENIVVSSTGTSSKGVRFGQNGGTSTLSSGRTITIGGSGFAFGSLRFRGFTQAGTTAQSWSQGSGTSQVYFETGTTFNGNITASFPQVFLNGSTFNGTATITKNGATENISDGGNTFASTTSIINSGTGRFIMGNTNADVFNGTLTLTSSSVSQINIAQTSTGNLFNENVILNSSGTSNGIFFGQNSGTSTLANGKTIAVGTEFSTGTLALRGFTQTGSTAQTLSNITNNAVISFESGSTFNAELSATASGILFSGSTFASSAQFIKNGASNDIGFGGCTFSGTTTIENSGTGDLTMASNSADVFNGALTVTNSGNALILLAHTATGNAYNQNIVLNCINTALGIRFGQNGGTSTLATGRTIAIGSSGYTNGDLRVRGLTQVGSTAQNLTTFGSGVEVYMESGTTFNGNTTLTATDLYLNGATYNGTATLTKTGSNVNTCSGGNVFNQTTIIENTGSGIWYLSSTNADDFNNTITFRQSNAGSLFPAYTNNSTFSRNVSTTGTTHPIEFGANGGIAIFDGSVLQNLSGSNSQSPLFHNVTINKSAGILDISVRMTILNNITFTSGRLKTSSTNILLIEDNATVSGANNSSFVSGPVAKKGDDAFTFPVGKANVYRPIGISAPDNTSTEFTAEFYYDNSDLYYTHASLDPSIHHLSSCEFWTLDRTAGSSSAFVTLSWNTSSCGVTNIADLLVCRWNGSTWKDQGNSVTTGNTSAGTVRSGGAISSFSPFTLGSTSTENPLPIELIHFSATPKGNVVDLKWTTASETNNQFFTIQRSKNAIDFEEIGKVSGAGNSNVTLDYSSTDLNPFSGVSYYRLKQTDYNGDFTYSPIEAVNFKNQSNPIEFNLLPNPTTDWFEVNFNHSNIQIKTLDLIDIKGNKILSQTPNEVEMESKSMKINVEKLPAGIYFVKLSDGYFIQTKKIIVTR